MIKSTYDSFRENRSHYYAVGPFQTGVCLGWREGLGRDGGGGGGGGRNSDEKRLLGRAVGVAPGGNQWNPITCSHHEAADSA